MKSFLLIILSFISSYLPASSVKITDSKVSFVALATPGALKISGKQTDSNGLKPEIRLENNQISGNVSLKLEALSTGIELRDKHMKENYLQKL